MATFAGLTTTGWLHSYTYSDGLGRELQTKVQAENGKAWVMQNGVPVQIDDITDRFVATGRKIYNNKGNVIKQYEPWFSDGHLYEPEAELTQYGVTPVMYYDAPGRLIKTEFPDGTLSRVEFDAWQQKTFDRNDCVNGSQWLTTMQQGTTAQQRAATLAQEHNDTPQVTDLDTMGRPYRITDDAGNSVYCTTVNHIDIAGLTIMVTDAMAVPRDMTRHLYDMTGQLCYTFNIDSGHRWMVVNALDKLVYTWDNLLRKTTIEYDALNRPVTTLLYNNNTTALKVESITYGTLAAGYTIGRPVIIRDQSGKVDITSYDFKGNMLSSTRRLCTDYNIIIDWYTYPVPTGESFITTFSFDAMNRPVTESTPDAKVRTYEYNKAGLLEKVKLGTVYYVDNINYNEKGQRVLIDFGNNTIINYYYDSKNFRLIRLVTTRDNNPSALQDLNYIYDPEGNIVEQADNAQQTFYFDNSIINPVGKYEYDALYRLVKAEGRELAELAMTNQTDCPIKPLNQNNGVIRNYNQLYAYDKLGNLQSVRSVINPWVRTYNYDTATNRLLNTGAGYNYTYDAHGNMISMPHLDTMEWDYKGNLVKTVGGTVTTYYRYDSSGNRVRKIAIKAGGITEERIYTGNYEVYRKKIGGNLDTERQSSFVSDDSKRIAIIDTRTMPSPVDETIRYQYDNHLGSASLELDSTAAIISYEEYHPFGSSSYRAGRNETETSLKRYRYVGKERDEETGLYYYGARYYAAWLCRFVSVDPLQFKYPHYTPYQYAGNKPISYIDLDGLEEFKNDSFAKMTSKSVSIDKPGTPTLRGYNNIYIGLKFASLKEYESYVDYKKLVSQKITALSNELKNPRANEGKIRDELSQFTCILKELSTIENNEDVVFRIKSGKNVSNDAAGGNNYYNVKTGEVDININSSDLTHTQLISHELKHAYQFFENKLGYGGLIGKYTYDLQDEREAYKRSNLFYTNESNYITDQEIIDGYKDSIRMSDINITTTDYLNSLQSTDMIKEGNKYHLEKKNYNSLRIYYGWKK